MSFDYYQILQISSTATNAEIKAAYRRLAKLFHPDKNPVAEEKFKQIKEAYETLIHCENRNKYDRKRNYDTDMRTQNNDTIKKQKTYTFTEQEIKRRQYYQGYYKSKKNIKWQKKVDIKPNYKELISILISIPITVALLLLLVSIYQKPKKEKGTCEISSKKVVSGIK